MKTLYFYLIALIFLALGTHAIDVSYTVETEALDTNNVSFTTQKDYTQQCDSSCKFDVVYDLPEGSAFQKYYVTYSSGSLFKAYFESSDKKSTTEQDDRVVVEVTPQQVCNANRCDSGCVKCSDKSCHASGFVCTEELTLDKISPTAIKVGDTQVNVLLRNTGTVTIREISIEITGDGITTIETVPINELLPGDKDYAFVKITSTKAGSIDSVIKILIGDKVKSKFIHQFTITGGESQNTAGYNATQLSDSVDSLKIKYRQLEQTYQDKLQQGYPVSLIYDKLRETYGTLTETQSLLFDGNYKRVQANINVINESLEDIEIQLTNIKLQKQSLGQTIKNNFLFFGSLAAAIVSILTALRLVNNSIDKKKMKKLHSKLRVMKKVDASSKRVKKSKNKEDQEEQLPD